CVLVVLFTYLCFFNDTTSHEIYTLSLHDALPISRRIYEGDDFNSTGERGDDPHLARAWPDYAALEAGGLAEWAERLLQPMLDALDRKSTRLNSSHVKISYAVFCLKKKKTTIKYVL